VLSRDIHGVRRYGGIRAGLLHRRDSGRGSLRIPGSSYWIDVRIEFRVILRRRYLFSSFFFRSFFLRTERKTKTNEEGEERERKKTRKQRKGKWEREIGFFFRI